MKTILFHTIASGAYSRFALPFTVAALASHKNAFVEILLDARFMAEFASTIPADLAYRVAPREIPKRYAPWRKTKPEERVNGYGSRHPYGSIRWLEPPRFLCDYTYTCDCDILNTDPGIIDFHTHQMKQSGMTYSNIVRQDLPDGSSQERMTGCHFATFEFWKNVPPKLLVEQRLRIDDGDLSHVDERLLYLICKECAGLPPKHWKGKYSRRPLHGLHLSCTRKPSDRMGWHITPKTVAEYCQLRCSPMWMEAKWHFDEKFTEMLETLEGEINEG